MPRLRIRKPLPLVHGWDERQIDLRQFVLNAKEMRTGWGVFFGGPDNYHWTIVREGDRVTVHSTWTEGDQELRDTWLAFDLAHIERLFNDPGWIAEQERCVRALHQVVEGPDWLKRLRARSLMPMRVDPIDGQELPDGSIDASFMAPLPVEQPWQEGSAFDWWSVHSASGKTLGLLRAMADAEGHRVPYYLSWRRIQQLWRRTLPELLGPTGFFHEPQGPPVDKEPPAA